ncbi:subtilisin-like protease SBT3.3 [Cynara cardunculus var. scolymus]|uniref:subtilisin-like protease SBT3.3 n=1 Tax=Cynara cardunculus var. scolymus TaxID=59895 RepID=UPI000D62386F|nr:subtilisin-like protease SBT3.3 [Cynara cardunculus var. scolymus]
MKLMQLFGLFLLVSLPVVHGAVDKRHYIVYMGQHMHPSSESVISANHEMLASVLESHNVAKEAAIHHYTKSFRGFSAMLTPGQATRLSENEAVVSVFESKLNRLHTTNSWRFLGLDSIQQYNKLPSDVKSDAIVGVIDTGVWPESESFHDYGLGPVSAKFNGECVSGQNFSRSNCNGKIIGARYYSKGFEAVNGPLENSNVTFFRSARDSQGHGTHTSSTIAGSKVSNASLYGLGSGTATGGVPNARLSIYKACWFDDCEDADILAAMDDAIHDGVDLISLSLGPLPPQPIYFQDAISIGAFHAFEKGIVVCASAGNSFLPRTASNVAPWILTVGASTMDRDFPSYVVLGNLKQLKGFGVNTTPDQGKQYGLITGSVTAASGIPSRNARYSNELSNCNKSNYGHKHNKDLAKSLR